jgi:nucleotide-binding universal stress UspA family protein
MNVNVSHASPPAGLNFKRILVPVDFSVCTLETLRYAKTLAERFNAIVDVLHVIQHGQGRQEEALSLPGLIRTLSDGARQELQRLVGILRAGDGATAFSSRVREGCAHEVILHEATATNAALIIMGTRNRSWFSGWLRHHTVKHVIQNAPCPVLVLRAGITNAKLPGLGNTAMSAAAFFGGLTLTE